MPKLHIGLFAEKHQGRGQEMNQDSIFCLSAENSATMPADVLAVLGVADGMGGPAARGIAGIVLTEYLTTLFMKGGYDTLAQQQDFRPIDHTVCINEVFQTLHRKIRERSAASHGRGPVGTTFTFGLIAYNAQDDRSYLHVGNVGNSRCYILRGDQIFHATEDDSRAWQLYKKGEITYAEMLVHPLRLTSTTIGMEDNVVPQVHSIEVLQDDIVLFCTDGLHETIDDDAIEYVINNSASTRDAVKRLLASAKAAGGTDDIAVALAYCSAKPIEANGGFAGGFSHGKMALHMKAIIGVWSVAAVLLLAAVITYFLYPAGPMPPPVAASLTVRTVQESETVREAVAAKEPAGVAVSTPTPAEPVPTVARVRAVTETPPPVITVEWNAQTRRFRIQVEGSAAVPIGLSCGNVSFDVVAVKSIRNLYKTTTPADSGMLPESNRVFIRLKGGRVNAVAVGFTRTD